MKFRYKAHKPGEENFVEGEIEADDRFALSRQMREQGMVLVSAAPLNNKWLSWVHLNEIVATVSLHDKVTFANNLSAMISAGLSLSRSLDVLARQTRNVKFKKAIQDVWVDVNSGTSLSMSLAKFPNIFSTVFVAMVSAGEESGNLPGALKLIGDQMEKTYTLRRKVRGAMIYPGVILSAMFGIGFLMMIFVVPNLVSTFKEFNVELPLSTRMIMAFSDILVNYGAYFLVSVALAIFVVYKIYKTQRGKRSSDFLLLHLPLISGIVKQMNSATAARTLSSLISSGVNMVESLNITEKVLQNSFYKDVLIEAKEGVQRGEPLSGFFQRQEQLFPILVGELMEVGEETGKLPEMLSSVATFYENEVEQVTKDMSVVIEPVLMIVIGIFVGFFAVSMIQPIYSITSAI